MKATRRSFFGFIGGAAVAGPTAAKSIVGPITSGGPPLGYPVTEVGAAAVGNPGRKAARIAELLKQLAGFRSPKDIERERMNKRDRGLYAYRYEVDGLRSISVRHKLSMISAREDQVDAERRRHRWLAELEDLQNS